MKRGIKTLIALVLLYLVYLFVKFFFLRRFFKVSRKKAEAMKDASRGASNSARPRKDAEETVVDPVCGNYIPLSTAVTADASGGRVYFCSNECRDVFIADKKRRAL